MKIVKILTIVGFVLSALAFAAAVVGANRATAIHWFGIGFVLAAFGITARLLLTPAEAFDAPSPLGFKLAALGFGLAAIPTAIGGFFFGKTDSELAIFFWPGFGLIVIGVLIHGWSILANKRG